MLEQLLNQIAIILILIAVAYYARKKGLITDAIHRGLSGLVVNIGVPAAILGMVSYEPEAYQRNMYFIGVLMSLVYHVGLFYVMNYLSPKLFKDPAQSKIAVLLVTFSNSMFLGFPILQGLYGTEILLYGGAIVVSFNLALYSVGLGSLQDKTEVKTPLWKKIITPFNIATAILIVFLYTGLGWPQPIQESLDYMSSINTPLSLFVIGSSLAISNLREVFTDKNLYLVTLLRCLIVPLVVLLILKVLPLNLDPDLIRAMVVLSAMPSAANNAMLAEETEVAPLWAARAVTQTTLLFMPTILIIVPLMEALL